MKRHLVLGHAHLDGLHTGRPADIGDARHLGDVGDLFGRLHHALAHGGCCHIDEPDSGESLFELVFQIEAHMVELDADAPGPAASDFSGRGSNCPSTSRCR